MEIPQRRRMEGVTRREMKGCEMITENLRTRERSLSAMISPRKRESRPTALPRSLQAPSFRTRPCSKHHLISSGGGGEEGGKGHMTKDFSRLMVNFFFRQLDFKSRKQDLMPEKVSTVLKSSMIATLVLWGLPAPRAEVKMGSADFAKQRPAVISPCILPLAEVIVWRFGRYKVEGAL